MKIPYNKKWILLEREDYANYLFVVDAWEKYTSLPKRWGFINARFLGAEYIDSACNLFVSKEQYDKANIVHFDYLFNNTKIWDNLHKLAEANSKEFFATGKAMKKIDASKLTNKQLLKWINIFLKGQVGVHVPRGVIFMLETPDNIITNYLQKYLEEIAGEIKVKIKPSDAFQVMIAPLKKSIWSKERGELIKIGLIKNKKKQQSRLKVHTKKYEWLEYGLQGKILNVDHFEKEIQKIKKTGLFKAQKDLQNEIPFLKKKQKEVISQYKIGRSHVKIFKIVQDSLYTRLYSKDSQFHGYYSAEKLFKEVGKRGGLTLEQVRFLSPKDYEEVLKDKDFSQITNERMKYSLHIADKGITKFFLGKDAKKIKTKLKFYSPKVDKKNTDVLKGQPAFKGKVNGRVKIINTIQEMVKIHPGNVLVSHMTNPGIVPAMKQAAAIVTDLGGITCHAAIVARELRKPCIIGTKIATQVLRDGDLVEVDADKGEVKVIK